MNNSFEILAKQIKDSYTALLDIYRKAPLAALTEPATSDGWLAKDILAHVAAWTWRCTALLDFAKDTNAPLETEPDVEGLNQEFYEERQNWDWCEIESDFYDAHKALLNAIQNLPTPRLNDPVVQKIIAESTWQHYESHLSDLQGWYYRAVRENNADQTRDTQKIPAALNRCKPMKAVIMAGGFGSRLYPLTVNTPKPMVPIVNKPVLGHVLDLLKRHNFREVVITVRYLADQIQAHFGDGRHLGMKIHYAFEETPLGTAGGVKNAQSFLGHEPFLVISSDVITDIDLADLVRVHQENRSVATMALIEVGDPSQYGVVSVNRSGRVLQFQEKPNHDERISNAINTGIYIFDPKIFDYMKPNVAYDFSYDILPRFLKLGIPFYGYHIDNYWCDIGTIQSYQQATTDILTNKVKAIDLGNYVGGGVWLGRNVQIDPTATLRGPIYLGNQVTIEAGVTIQGPAVIYDHSVVSRNACIKESIIGYGNFVSSFAKVENTVTSAKCTLPPYSTTIHETLSNSQSVFHFTHSPSVFTQQPGVSIANSG